MSGQAKELRLIEVDTSTGRMFVPYELRRSRRSRHLRLSIGRTSHALVTVPWTCSFEEARAFLRGQGDWLVKHMTASGRHASLLDYLHRYPRLVGFGRTFRVEIGFTRFRPEYVYSIEAAEIALRIRADEQVEPDLRTLLRAFATETLPQRTRELAGLAELDVKRVSVRDQSTRWGSCSTSGTLSLNWRLILLRPNLQDHILYHELAHLREMNHSQKFWDLLRQMDPKTDSHNRQLVAASARLMDLGRPV